MMNFNKLAKNNNVKIVVVIALIGAVVLFADPFGQFAHNISHDIYTLGTVKSYEIGDSAVLTASSIVDADKGITVVFEPDRMSDINYVDAYIYPYSGVYNYAGSIQKASVSEKTDRFIYTFSLDPLPAGDKQYYIGFSGAQTSSSDFEVPMIHGHTTAFTISKTTGEVFADPTISEGPGNKDAAIGDRIDLVWYFKFEGPSTQRLYVDGVIKSTRTSLGTTQNQVFTYGFTPTAEVAYTIKFEVDPDSDNQLAINTIAINGEVTGTDADPTIRVGPDGQDALIGEIIRLTWLYTYEGSADLNLYIDSILIETETFAGATTERTYTYDFVPESETSYTIKFEVDPDSDENSLVYDSVELTGVTEIDTTTTTTTDDPEPDDGLTTILIIGGALIAGVIVVLVVLKKSPLGGGGYSGGY